MRITDPAAVDEAVATAAGPLGSLDVPVNNVGIGAVGDIADNDDTEWARVLDVDVTGIARVTRAALPHMLHSPVEPRPPHGCRHHRATCAVVPPGCPCPHLPGRGHGRPRAPVPGRRPR
ncbi:SDR family oxidoreductase [Streptomyces brasiliscabiei]|uniref:SDR family oxidoreductase n=1 Tax=Streptomyces brasiliscabiei TaxID=2736302 RepID=UPI0034D5C860